MSDYKRLSFILFWLLLIMLLIFTACTPYYRPLIEHKTTTSSPPFVLEETVSNVVVIRIINNQGPPFLLVEEQLTFVGKFEERTNTEDRLLSQNDLKVISLDAYTGEIKWQVDAPNNTGYFATDSERFYFEADRNSCPTGIRALDLRSGKELWRIDLNDDCKGADYLAVLDSHLYARTSQRGFGDYYQIVPETGEILQVTSARADYSPAIFHIDYSPYTEYKMTNNGIVIAEGANSWLTNPGPPNGGPDSSAPIVLDHAFFLKATNVGSVGYYIWAVKKEDGTILWRYDEDIISNVATNRRYAFFLTDAPSLIAVDLLTGEKRAEVLFTPGLVEVDVINTAFFVAASEDSVAVYLGSSNQIFIFRLKNN